MKTAKLPIYTIGHSNRTFDEFLELLKASHVELVVDIRKMPKSRNNPQFEGTTLRRSLEKAGIGYVHEPLLGGLRRAQKDSLNNGWRNASFRGFADYMATDDFTRGLNGLLDRAGETRTAIMCAEAVPWRCHRSLVADALKASGRRVLDIISRAKPSPHRYTPFLRRRRGVLTYPASALSAR